ncbi:MAG: AAA family ATPase [Candidatus Wukongarchaeota archaeon]|nr:MoxR family ATPase [Candidatus Wukongarchaeota archaeon]
MKEEEGEEEPIMEFFEMTEEGGEAVTPMEIVMPAPALEGEEVPSVDTKDIERVWQKIKEEMGKVVVGKLDIIESLFIALLSGGHVLMEGVPGIAKTWTANNFSNTLGCEFKRIQFTPDLLPSDILGTNVYDPKSGAFHLRQGPIFANIILADEINRAPPKTQSAMLECMQEAQVSIEGVTYPLDKPFIVLATQNPIELEGTYPLAEAAQDRFLLKVLLDFPNPEEEAQVIKIKHERKYSGVKKVTSPKTIAEMQKTVEEIYISDELIYYIRDIVVRTRRDPRCLSGCSPRGSLTLLKVSKAHAAIRGRDYVVPDDIRKYASWALHHRMILKPEAELEGVTQVRVVEEILNDTPVPV